MHIGPNHEPSHSLGLWGAAIPMVDAHAGKIANAKSADLCSADVVLAVRGCI